MISHHHRCIFIHIPKNAGQSIESFFLNSLGLSWENRAPLLLRYNNNPELGPPRLAHLLAADYVRYKYLPQSMYDEYFKFAIVRNPWDRTVSMYRYLGDPQKETFSEFVRNRFMLEQWQERFWFVRPQSDFICSDSGELMIDYLGRFETLKEDFETILSKLGLPSQPLPHVNKSVSTGAGKKSGLLKGLLSRNEANTGQVDTKKEKSKKYQDYYDEDTYKLVSNLYIKDIESFGYEFDG